MLSKSICLAYPFQTSINDLQTYQILMEEIATGAIEQNPRQITEREWYVIWNEVYENFDEYL